MNAIPQELLNILKIVCDYKEEQFDLNLLNKDTHLKDDLGLDSLELAELTVRIEDQFGVDIFADGLVATIGEVLQKLNNEKVISGR